jgi:phage gp29-like protein
MKNPFRNVFARPATEGAAVGSADAQVGLYEEEATTQLVQMLTRIPDIDEVLKQAGIRRDKLRVLLYDDEIAQACETRLDALLAVPFRIEPSEGPAAEFLEEMLTPMMRDAIAGAFQARLFGYSVLEAVYYKRADGKIGLSYLGEKPFEWFEPKSDGRLMFFPDDGSGGSTGVEVDQRHKFFLTRSRPTYRQPYGEALLSRLYWPWYFRANGWKFWGKFLERFGTPLLVGKSSDPKAMVRALLLAHSQAVIGVDVKDDVTTVGAPSGNNGQAFDGFETAIIRRIQKVVLGQTLTSGTDGGSGTRALGQVHDSVRTDKRDSDIQLVINTVQRVADALCELNGLGRHTIVFADETGLESERAKRDNDLYKVGVRFNKGYFADNYDLYEEDFTLLSDALGEGPPPQPVSGAAANPDELSDAQPAANARAGAKAGKGPPHFFTKGKQGELEFTPEQQEIEDIADDTQTEAATPLGTAIREAVLLADSPEDLQDRLFALIGGKVSLDEFRLVTERALYAADVVGYVASEKEV